MNNDEIIEKLINGYSLYTYMIPDDTIPTNRPLHAEGFYLPHVLITGDVFWGMSRAVHFLHSEKEFGLVSFCYTNRRGGVFFSYTPDVQNIVFMSLKRYKSHRFVLKDRWELIWDSENKNYQNTRIDDCIKQGLSFKVAMLDVENMWNIHPVDLPMYHINERRFSIRTEYFDYASILRQPENIDSFVREHKMFFSKKPESNKDGTLRGNCPPFRSFYNLFDNSEYYNFYDIPRGSRQRYQRLKVFCEKARGGLPVR